MNRLDHRNYIGIKQISDEFENVEKTIMILKLRNFQIN